MHRYTIVITKSAEKELAKLPVQTPAVADYLDTNVTR